MNDGVLMTSGQVTARIKNIEEWHKFKENAEKNGVKIGEALENLLILYNNNKIINFEEMETMKNNYDSSQKTIEKLKKEVAKLKEENNNLEKDNSSLNNKLLDLDTKNTTLINSNNDLQNKINEQEEKINDITKENNKLVIQTSNDKNISEKLEESTDMIAELKSEKEKLSFTNK